MINGDDGQNSLKRHGASERNATYRDDGYLPEALN